MPKGKPLAGKRKAGGGRKPLPPERQTVIKSYRATPAEHAALKELLRQIRAETP